jgi:DNA (cytosine-5)-methyltransferase 3A
MNILSLFDGISCARQALEKNQFMPSKYFASEIDKYAIQIALENYPDTIQVGSVVGLDTKQFKDIDLLIGGSPCQDLSIAKKGRQGLAGERSGLFWEYIRILKEVQPKYFVLENVNSMPKADKAIISETLGLEPVMINASLVSAQNRKRLFWVGRLVDGKYEKVEISQPQDRGILLKDILEEEVDEKYFISEKGLNYMNGDSGKYSDRWSFLNDSSEPKSQTLVSNLYKGLPYNVLKVKGLCEQDGKSKTLLSSCYKGYGNDGVTTIRVGDIGSNAQAHRVYSPEGKAVNLTSGGGGQGAKTGLYAIAQRGRYDSEGKTKQQYETSFNEKSNSLTLVQKDSLVYEPPIIRKLTPIECERLQGLPDNYTEGVSNTQRYKALGNAFNADVVAYILGFCLTKNR